VGVSEVSADKMKALKLPEERGAAPRKDRSRQPGGQGGPEENDVVAGNQRAAHRGTDSFAA